MNIGVTVDRVILNVRVRVVPESSFVNNNNAPRDGSRSFFKAEWGKDDVTLIKKTLNFFFRQMTFLIYPRAIVSVVRVDSDDYFV